MHDAEIALELSDSATTGDPDRDRDLLRIAQEAVQNALRHSAARRVSVRLGDGGDGFELVVADDGIGFDPKAPELRSRRLGLTSMEERAERIGARLEVASEPGTGTTVRLVALGVRGG